MEEIYVGGGATYVDVYIAANKHTNVESPTRFTAICNNNKIIVVYKANNTYMGIPRINGMDIPMISSTFTDSDVVYNVLTSVNSYTGTFNVDI